VRREVFTVDDVLTTDDDIAVVVSYDFKEGSTYYAEDKYDFKFKRVNKCILNKYGLKVEDSLTNTGDKKMPFGTGRHPSFRTLTTPENANITVLADY
jgi:galactose mutarotase-like enzyme